MGIQIIHNFFSPPENINRTIRVYTPPEYNQQPDRAFPVLYVFDGQNIFAHPESAVLDTWCLNWTLEQLVSEGKVTPWIVVGIDHTDDRMAEYSSWVGGRANLCGEFLINHLKPYIDKTYRTLSDARHTGVMGSSMGGLITLYLGKTYPQIFGRLGVLSPALMWGNGYMFGYWDTPTHQWSKISLYVGSAEQYSFNGIWLDYVPITRDFYNHLKQLGYQDYEVQFRLAEGATHYETAWRQQTYFILPWLLADVN